MTLHSKWVASLKKKETLKALTLTIILFSAVWMFNLQTSQASKTLVVPQDYPTIGEAISHASAGDTIQVKGGIYNENIVIDKSLTIVGQNSPVIVGNGGPTPSATLTLDADNIVVSGLVIESYQEPEHHTILIWDMGSRRRLYNNRQHHPSTPISVSFAAPNPTPQSQRTQ